MNKVYIKLTTCESGDWQILEACDKSGVIYETSGHSINQDDWIKLLNILGKIVGSFREVE